MVIHAAIVEVLAAIVTCHTAQCVDVLAAELAEFAVHVHVHVPE
jgi:hypothetical protein